MLGQFCLVCLTLTIQWKERPSLFLAFSPKEKEIWQGRASCEQRGIGAQRAEANFPAYGGRALLPLLGERAGADQKPTAWMRLMPNANHHFFRAPIILFTHPQRIGEEFGHVLGAGGSQMFDLVAATGAGGDEHGARRLLVDASDERSGDLKG